MVDEKLEEQKEPPVPEPITPITDKVVEMTKNANDAAARMEQANIQLEKNMDRQEAMNVEKRLGGQAQAGTSTPEESDEDYANRVIQNDVPQKKP